MREAIQFVVERSPAPAAPRSTPGTRIARSTATEKPGDQVDRYKLLHSIGEGGMGIVYLAEQEPPVRRRVALKVIKLGMDTKAVIARFEAERQTLALMDHPNIARVLDAGTTAAGRPYFVMELVRGIRITDYCDQNQCPPQQRLTLFLQICRAIQHAHRKGIIHRDIKPSNILVALHDGVPVPKIIDFGIAKATRDRSSPDQTALTGIAQFLGTPAYMSPEQTEANSQDIDTRSDVYSLGVLLYELLTGRTPFEADELRQTGLEGMCRIIREREPPRPSVCLTQELAVVASQMRSKSEAGAGSSRRLFQLKELIALVQDDLDWIVIKALEKERARRYGSANDLAMDLQRFLENEPILARPPSTVYRFQKLVRRNKLAAVAVSALGVALIAGLTTSTWLYFREKAEYQRALTAEARTRREAQKSETVAQFLKTMLQSLDPELARGQHTPMLHKILDQTAGRITTDLTSQPEIQAELASIIGNAYYEMEDFIQAEVMYRDALRLRKTVFGMPHGLVAASLNDLGRALTMNDRQVEGEALHRQALAMRELLFGSQSAEVAKSLTSLADNLTDQRKLAEAEELQRAALAIQRKLLNADHPDIALSLKNLGRIFRLGVRLPEAEAAYREMVALTPGKESLELSDALQKLTDVLRDQGKQVEAEITCREVLAMNRRLLGIEHPMTAFSFNDLALMLQRDGRLAEAEALFRERLHGLQKRFPADDDQIIGQLIELSQVLVSQNKFIEAEVTARQCLALLEKKSPDEWITFCCQSSLGGILLEQKNYVEAEALLHSGYEGMKQREARLPPAGRPYFIESLRRLVHFYQVTGRADQADEWRQKLVAFDQTVPTANAVGATKPQ